MTPKIGQYLYASCAGEDYGKVLSVGIDSNGYDTIDIEVRDPNEILWFPDEELHSLAQIELPEGVKLVLRNIQWKSVSDDMIECNTPGNNCYRCTKLFFPKDTPTLLCPSQT